MFFSGNKESVRKQIGMAVPCEGAKIIFEAILKSFAGIEYESVECNAMEYMFNSEEDSKWQFDADLEKKVLIDPAKEGANELRIVSAYASPSMVAWHIQALADLKIQPVQIKLIVGMCPFDGLSMVANSGFKKLTEADFGPEYSSFNCQYVYKSPAVHLRVVSVISSLIGGNLSAPGAESHKMTCQIIVFHYCFALAIFVWYFLYRHIT